MKTDLRTYKAEYLWTEQEFIRSSKLNGRMQLRPSIAVAANITALFLIALSLLILAIDGLQSSAGVAPLIIATLSLCWLLRKFGRNRWLRKMFGRHLSADALMQWEFNVDEVTTRCGDLSAANFKWKLVGKLVEAKDGFLLCIGGTGFWLPLAAFEDREGVEMLREFAKFNGVKYLQTNG